MMASSNPARVASVSANASPNRTAPPMIDPHHLSFFHINTAEDLDMAQAMVPRVGKMHAHTG